jgi:hypothetical protein
MPSGIRASRSSGEASFGAVYIAPTSLNVSVAVLLYYSILIPSSLLSYHLHSSLLYPINPYLNTKFFPQLIPLYSPLPTIKPSLLSFYPFSFSLFYNNSRLILSLHMFIYY